MAMMTSSEEERPQNLLPFRPKIVDPQPPNDRLPLSFWGGKGPYKFGEQKEGPLLESFKPKQVISSLSRMITVGNTARNRGQIR